MNDNKDGLIACRCSNCGAPIIIEEGQEYVTCEYCDTVFKVKTDKDRLIDMLVYGGTQYSAPQKRKGIAERTLEDKRKREEAKEREAAAERERQFRAEQAEKEREFRAEQAEIARKRDPGYILVQLLLWACFYPVMLLAVILKRLSEKNRNNELIAKGLSPKRVTEFPLLYMIVCGLIFFSIFSGFLFTPSGYSSNSSNITTEPTVTTATEWYEQEPMEFRDTSFTEEALIDRVDEFMYDDLSAEEFKQLIKTDYYNWTKGESIKNSKAYPCVLKDYRGLFITGDIVFTKTNEPGTLLLTSLYRKNKCIVIAALNADDGHNITIDDYCAILNSLEIAN